MGKLHEQIAQATDFGGHLECTVCKKAQPLGDTATYYASGWPKCHGYTMTWITARMEQL
jgi:hypothetical protein